ncbi:CrcB family protein [Halorubrum sp. BV1]|uniref:fluoride efflux transporter FluC n=1 Tax=Halorubrum sp. BV1 TaxID=1498500 RepID=UPI000679DECD|nr:CrcB family protein [Halorubrum sp. BV1]
MTGAVPAVVLVGLGGALGAAARHAVGIRIEGRLSVTVVNALGSLALGGTLATPIGSAGTLLAAVGFCGAFTTFSSFAVETVSTAAGGSSGRAARFAAVNLVVALCAFLVGTLLAGALAGGLG